MKPIDQIVKDAGRLMQVAEVGADGFRGLFRLKGTQSMRFVASWGLGWDHVSVSLPDRCPTWEEMAFVKGLFFADDETAMQLHPPKAEYVNCHPYCLHLWRPQRADIPRPSSILVGAK